MKKDSIILYVQQYESIKALSREDKGMLLDAIFHYHITGEVLHGLSPMIEMAFSFIRTSMDLDQKKYIAKCEKNKLNARLRWEQTDTTGCDRIETDANHADTDTDTETEKDTEKEIIDTNVSTSNSRSNSTRHDDIDYEKLINFFNSKTNGVFGNVRYPISEKRRGMIRARIREYGKEAFAEMINLAVNSNFLKGDNKSGFRASLDWMIKPNNFQKIIEGNYNNSVTHNDRLLTYDQVLLMVQKGEATFDRYKKVQGRDGKMHYKRKE